MKENNIINMKSKVDRLLKDYQIKAALDILRSMLYEAGLNNLVSKADTIEETYKYMIQYMLAGARDDSRDNLLADISENILSLCDMAVRAVKRIDDNGYYYSTLRFNEYKKEHISEILKEYGNTVSEMSLAEAVDNDVTELRKNKEALLERMFNSLFTSLGKDNEYRDVVNYITSGYADNNITSLALSAMTLSLLCFYDKSKMTALLDIYESADNESIAARALVGIMFSLSYNKDRIESDPKLKARLYMWNDSIETFRRLRETIRVIIATRDTERITAKMKDEVIPELMKLRPDIMKTLNESNTTDIEAAMLENNPEWEEILEKSGLNKKMKELSDLQSEGADLMMVTFSNLKQFPFFDSASNWFLPFDANNTALSLDDAMRKFINMLSNSGNMICDSDMYSLALSAARMPETQRNMLTSQLNAQFDQLSEEMKSARLKSSTPVFDSEVQKVVRDLYRFFKLFKKREGLYDPFSRPFDFTSLPVLGDMMQEEDVLQLVGEFYFKRGYYKEALPILLNLCEKRSDEATLYEKIGFCYQSESDFIQALNAYEKASLLKSPGPWLTNKLAYINRRLGNYEAAAEYYQKALDMEPDNVSLLMNAGNMQLQIDDLTGALRHFYHANYISPDNIKVLRAIAWVELLNGNFDKSHDYYDKVISQGANSADYLNAGHAALLQKDFRNSLNLYRLSAKEKSNEFKNAFIQDLDTIVKLGIDKKTALLMLDPVLNSSTF